MLEASNSKENLPRECHKMLPESVIPFLGIVTTRFKKKRSD